jgi:hypothetical protein
MATEISAVQSVSMMSGDLGWSFHLRDCTGRRWIRITYRTEAEAKAAREKMEAAMADAIEVAVDLNSRVTATIG